MMNTLITSLLLAAPALAGLPPLVQKGSELVDSSTGDRFSIIGVDYQPGGSSAFSTTADPLSDPSACLRDAVMMQKLGTNTIRVYNVAPNLNHDECMSIFDAAGIYVIIDVNSPLEGQYLDRSDPFGTYNLGYIQHIFSVVENFMDYSNLLGFFSGNEIINDDLTTSASTAYYNPPFIRAIQRDLKNYIAKNAPRQILVGYSAADISENLQDQWLYLECDNGDNSSSDFFGLNDYEWCGGAATFESSGYATLIQMFQGTAIPIFFSEYGCNNVLPRVFDEVLALYGSQMTLMCGGLVYEWTEEPDNYGLVNINDNSSMSLLGDYVTFQGKLDQISLTTLKTANTTAQNAKAPQCTSSLITYQGFNNSWTLPEIPSGGQQLIDNGVGSSVTAGTFTSVTATSVTVSVYNTAGSPLSNLVLTTVGDANTPNTASAGSAATTTKKSSAATGHPINMGHALAGAIGVLAVI